PLPPALRPPPVRAGHSAGLPPSKARRRQARQTKDRQKKDRRRRAVVGHQWRVARKLVFSAHFPSARFPVRSPVFCDSSHTGLCPVSVILAGICKCPTSSVKCFWWTCCRD